MAIIAETIIKDIFADDGCILDANYISGGLHLRGRTHTQEQLIQTLEQLIACGCITDTDQGYQRIN